MKLCVMEIKDLDAVLELEKACFHVPWNKEQVLYELNENPFSTGYLLKEGDQVLGFAFLWITFEMAQLAQIGIHPDYRQQGHATTLLKQLMQIAADSGCEFFTLEVRESNAAARKLYENQGMIQVNISKNYYSNGENAVVYTVAV